MAMIQEDGTVVLSLPEQVEENKAKVEEVDIKVDNLAARVEAALAGVLHYKGSVATYSDLPLDAEIGDVYNVIDTGANYAWTGSEWDELGSVVDLSNCVTLDGAQTITGDKTFDDAKVKFSNSSSTVYYIGKESNDLMIRTTDSSGYILQLSSSGYIYSKANFLPFSPAGYDLGSSIYKWKDLYLSNNVKCKNNSASYYWSLGENSSNDLLLTNSSDGTNYDNVAWFDSGKQLHIGAIMPKSNNTYDLGSSSFNWKDLYLAGNLSDGTNSVSVANIVTTDTDQTIDGNKTFDQGTTLSFKAEGNYYGFVGDNTWTLGLKVGNNFIFRFSSSAFYPAVNITKDLGTTTYKWKDFYLSGNISDGTNSVNVADLKALIDYAKAQGWIS